MLKVEANHQAKVEQVAPIKGRVKLTPT